MKRQGHTTQERTVHKARKQEQAKEHTTICPKRRKSSQCQTVEWQDILLLSSNHKYSHTHQVKECNTYKKMTKDENKRQNPTIVKFQWIWIS